MRKFGFTLIAAVAVLFVLLPLIVACRGDDRKLFHVPPAKTPTLRDDAELLQLRDDVETLTGVVQAGFFAVDAVTKERDELRVRVKELEAQLLTAKAAPVDQIDISGLGELKATSRPLQWVITTSPGCGHCPGYKRSLKHRLKDWDVSDSPDAHFRLVEITDAEWQQRGITLPLSELHSRGRVVAVRVGVVNPDELANLYIEWSKAPAESEQSYGVGVGSLPIKPQIAALLQALKPFLDGGTLRVEYKPRAGVVREWLTVRQGAGGVKIPATTAVTFSFDGEQLVGKFDGQSPRVIVGPFERGPTSVEVSTERIAIRLPWCPDPEVQFVDPGR